MTVVARRRAQVRTVYLDKWLEAVPVFRLSDSADDGALGFIGEERTRWRVLPAPDERLPGTFDQDVYVELMRRYQEAGSPSDGVVTFTLHAFLRSMARRVDGRTYEQLRAALTRLERTIIEYTLPTPDDTPHESRRFSIVSDAAAVRPRLAEREQLPLLPAVASPHPRGARVALSPLTREHLGSHQAVGHSNATYPA